MPNVGSMPKYIPKKRMQTSARTNPGSEILINTNTLQAYVQRTFARISGNDADAHPNEPGDDRGGDGEQQCIGKDLGYLIDDGLPGIPGVPEIAE